MWLGAGFDFDIGNVVAIAIALICAGPGKGDELIDIPAKACAKIDLGRRVKNIPEPLELAAVIEPAVTAETFRYVELCREVSAYFAFVHNALRESGHNSRPENGMVSRIGSE